MSALKFEQMKLKVGDLTFDARAAGPEGGELVLLLHGFPQTSYEWRRQLTALGDAGYRAVAPDQRGYSPGARPPDVEDYNIIALAQDVMGMATALGASRYHVVGHDWGAGVAWVVAAADADRVITVTPMSVPHPDAFRALLADETSKQRAASAYFEALSQPNAADIILADDAAALRAAYEGVEPEAIEEYMRVVRNKEALTAALNWYRANVATRQFDAPSLGAIRVPTLFIWSDEDPALLREGAELTASHVSGPYRFEIISGVNHWLVDIAPDRVTELLLDHLRRFGGAKE